MFDSRVAASALVDSVAVDGALVDRMIARLRRVSHDQALLLADLIAVADVTPNPEFAAFEISCALTWTRQAATTQLELAENIVRRLPDVHSAVLAGDIDLPKARVIANGLATLALPLARRVAAAILLLAPRLTTGELGPRLSRMIIKADPHAAAKRREARVRKRRVEFQPTEDSCAALLGLDLPAESALAASNRLTEIARAMKRAGDPRSMDQLRADTFLNLLLGKTCACHDLLGNTCGCHDQTAGLGLHDRSPAANARSQGPADRFARQGAAEPSQLRAQPAATAVPCCRCAGGSGRLTGGVELTGTLEMLARLTNQPGDLGGYGPVIADVARQVAEQQRRSPWTFTIRDDATGQVFTGPTRRRPTEAMARNIRARDRTCRAPGCRRIGIYTDIDHTIAYQDGGRTVEGNLGLVCRYHHRAKHEGFWRLVQIRPGVFVWISPLGRRYIVYPAAP